MTVETFFFLLHIAEDVPEADIEKGIGVYLRDFGPLSSLEPFLQTAVSVLRTPEPRALYRRLLEAARERKSIPAQFNEMERGQEWGFAFTQDPEKPSHVVVLFGDEVSPEEPRIETPKEEYPTDFLLHLAHLLGYGKAHLKTVSFVGVVLLLGLGVLLGLPRVTAFVLEGEIREELSEARRVLEDLRGARAELAKEKRKVEETPELLDRAAVLYPTVAEALARLRRFEPPSDEMLSKRDAEILRIQGSLEKDVAVSKDAKDLEALTAWGKDILEDLDEHLTSLDHVAEMMEAVKFQESGFTKEESR